MNLDRLPSHSRVWIYQSDRPLSRTEQSFLNDHMSAFVKEWNAHGQQLSAGFDFLHDRFLILAVDEKQAAASGCSIDSSVAAIKALEKEIGVDFFNRQLVAYETEDSAIEVKPLHDFWALRKAGVVNDETVVYNNLVKDLEEFNSSWRTSFGKSWHAEMFR